MTILVPITPECGPPARGHYSSGMRVGSLLFVSGQIAVTEAGLSLASDSLAVQTHQALANMRGVIEASGGRLDQVVKVNVYLTDPDGWPVFNQIYADFFGDHKPTRTVVPVNPFYGGFLVEVDAVVFLGN
jgi:reactive intermediate/imine deaminase